MPAPAGAGALAAKYQRWACAPGDRRRLDLGRFAAQMWPAAEFNCMNAEGAWSVHDWYRPGPIRGHYRATGITSAVCLKESSFGGAKRMA